MSNYGIADIDLSQLLDLRVDYAFKRFFATDDTRWLVFLLNAIFADKGIHRAITSLSVVNPYEEEIGMAVKALSLISTDPETRFEYEKRKADLYFQEQSRYWMEKRIEEERRRADEERRRADKTDDLLYATIWNLHRKNISPAEIAAITQLPEEKICAVLQTEQLRS
jgi:hypothetical protein